MKTGLLFYAHYGTDYAKYTKGNLYWLIH